MRTTKKQRIWYGAILVIAALIAIDVTEAFTFSDVPFLIGFVIYTIAVRKAHADFRWSFGITCLLLLLAWCFYIPTGAGIVTERLAVWFYLFFLYGLIQYWIRVWKAGNK